MSSNENNTCLLNLTECAFTFDLEQYKDDLQLYFRQDWTVSKFLAVRKYNLLPANNLHFLIMLSEGLTFDRINKLPGNPRLILSFRKRAQDSLGFVLVCVNRKGW